MIKFLFDKFRDAPIVGTPIKLAYVGYLVKGIINDGKHSNSASELKTLSGDELETALNDQANGLWDDNITPQITQYSIPESLVAPVKEKAIAKIVAKLREQIGQKVEQVVEKKL